MIKLSYPLDLIYKEAQGVSLVLFSECSACKKETKHFFAERNDRFIIYDCFLCEQTTQVLLSDLVPLEVLDA